MPTSFKKNLQTIPSRYRTPSPPRDAFEPLSPIATDEFPSRKSSLQSSNDGELCNGLKRPYSAYYHETNRPKDQKHRSGAAMDAFASIALATTSSQYQRIIATNPQPTSDHIDRPSKRARSEKLASPDWSKKRKDSDTRPATSYEQSPEDRRLEAELLLNFAHTNYAQAAAQLTSPSPVHPQVVRTHSPTLLYSTKDGAVENTNDDHIGHERGCDNDRAQEKENVNKSSFAQVSPQTNMLLGDQSAREETTSGQCEGKGPSITIERTDESLGLDNKIDHAGDTAEIPEISELDDVDLIPEPLRSRKGSITAQEQVPQQDLDQKHDVNPESNVVPITFNDIMLEGQSTSETSHQAYSNKEQSVEDTSRVVESAMTEEEGDASLEGEPSNTSNAQEMQRLHQEDMEIESRVIHGALGDTVLAMNEGSETHANFSKPSPPSIVAYLGSGSPPSTPDLPSHPTMAAAACAKCHFVRNSDGVEPETDSTSWISCDACKSWFHFACAGFKSVREVRGVDKYRCKSCKPIHGSTTYVRKSSRAHSAIDYAGLHQGVIKTSDERPEHHYIKPIKEGTITFLPETFARMRPELVTAEYFEKGTGMKEPIVIPAYLNSSSSAAASSDNISIDQDEGDGQAPEWFPRHPEREIVQDYGQDALDMVIPQGLTVRQVAELYGPEEKVEVIDVKSQNGESKKWNMRRWADYYENPNNKVVRNVISLEVSQSKLGRLIKRPQIVRDLDLQDSVWPEDLLAKGEYPRVQFYCLMSVADCFTDFHIDFGGSSVFYHILKGKKTFLFIPPKEKHLKKYEEWCMSPAQNWTFLGDQTKECYRVDLSEGDTMLIPSGWIHAVWTPEDSLVIGGNFLTRMNFAMQLRIAQVEKATGVARKFRYPHFQKLHWYTALQYLETDPLPDNVRELLHAGGSFHREKASYYEFDAWGENSQAGLDNYHARYYSQAELDGLPDLTRYLLRTALIDIGSITDGISADTRNAVKKSIPRGHGEPLEIIKTFAAWCAWKRGNEPLPHWAYPDAVPEGLAPDKLSAAAMKKLDHEAALSAPRRHSARMQSQQELSARASSEARVSNASTPGSAKRPNFEFSASGQSAFTLSSSPKRPRFASGVGSSSHRKTACESCRKRRRACKHKDQVAASMATPGISMAGAQSMGFQQDSPNPTASPYTINDASRHQSDVDGIHEAQFARNDVVSINNPQNSFDQQPNILEPYQLNHPVSAQMTTPSQDRIAQWASGDLHLSANSIQGLESMSGIAMQPRPRHKACNECRKSKRRCIHDAFGNEDPVKVRETAIPRPHARKSNLQSKDASVKKSAMPKPKLAHPTGSNYISPTANPLAGDSLRMRAPVANMIAQPPSLESLVNDTSITLDVAKQRDIAEQASLLLDPALLWDNANDLSAHHNQSLPLSIPRASLESANEVPHGMPTQLAVDSKHQHSPISTEPTSYSKPEPAHLEPKDSFEQPASSLVSPPASLHDDVGNSPVNQNPEWVPSRSASEQSSTQLKQMQQRYTPESGPMRRASSSSYDKATPEQTACPEIVEASPSQKARAGLNSEYMADEESLRLIKELQAQELGLRRRGKA